MESRLKENLMMSKNFLDHRAIGHRQIADGYEELSRICKLFDLTPKSGDLYTEASWPQPVAEDGEIHYWPRNREGAVLLCIEGQFPEHIGAVKVRNDGDFYGCILGRGMQPHFENHDLNAGELEHGLRRLGYEDINFFKAMRPIKVTYADGNTMITSINGSKQEVRRHYIGKKFNFGDTDFGVPDKMVEAVKVEFLD
jgi:hypothetical protein